MTKGGTGEMCPIDLLLSAESVYDLPIASDQIGIGLSSTVKSFKKYLREFETCQ